jgi:hypothetical protein
LRALIHRIGWLSFGVASADDGSLSEPINPNGDDYEDRASDQKIIRQPIADRLVSGSADCANHEKKKTEPKEEPD